MHEPDTSPSTSGDSYVARVRAIRSQLPREPSLSELVGVRPEADRAHAFVIRLALTEIQLADRSAPCIEAGAQRADTLGQAELAASLARVAEETWAFQESILECMPRLIRDWNQRWRRRVDLVASLSTVPSPPLDQVVFLHERAAKSSTPAALLAIAYEIAAMAEALPKLMIAAFREQLGDRDDASVAWLDRRGPRCDQLFARLCEHLTKFPEQELALAEAGAAAMTAFGRLLTDCSQSNPRLEEMGLAASSSSGDQ